MIPSHTSRHCLFPISESPQGVCGSPYFGPFGRESHLWCAVHEPTMERPEVGCLYPLPGNDGRVCKEPLAGRGRRLWCPTHTSIIRVAQNRINKQRSRLDNPQVDKFNDWIYRRVKALYPPVRSIADDHDSVPDRRALAQILKRAFKFGYPEDRTLILYSKFNKATRGTDLHTYAVIRLDLGRMCRLLVSRRPMQLRFECDPDETPSWFDGPVRQTPGACRLTDLLYGWVDEAVRCGWDLTGVLEVLPVPREQPSSGRTLYIWRVLQTARPILTLRGRIPRPDDPVRQLWNRFDLRPAFAPHTLEFRRTVTTEHPD